MKNKTPSLLFCIFLDTIGCLSYTIPVIGELSDLIWAPLSAVIFYFLFGRKKFGWNGAAFSFIEELFPGLDFIPTFTIAWVIKNMQAKYNGQGLSKSAIRNSVIR